MSVNNGIITAPVSIDDVKSVLGESSNDIATLCTSKNINMWAKYKPTSYPAPFPSDWYKGSDGNYGLNITASGNGTSSTSGLVQKYYQNDENNDLVNGYKNLYKRPTGGSSSPYRLGDFRGYNHNAYPGIEGILPINSFKDSDVIQLDVTKTSLSGSDMVTYDDIGIFNKLYFGFVVCDSSGKFKAIVTASKTVGNGSYTCSLKAKTLAVGNYIAYPMFSSVDYSSTYDYNGDTTLYAVPNLSPASFRVVSGSSVDGSNLDVTASISGTTITVVLKNKSTSSYIENVGIYCVYSTNPTSSSWSPAAKEYSRNIGNLAKEQTVTITFSNIDTSKFYLLYVSAKSGWVIEGMPVDGGSVMPDI